MQRLVMSPDAWTSNVQEKPYTLEVFLPRAPSIDFARIFGCYKLLYSESVAIDRLER